MKKLLFQVLCILMIGSFLFGCAGPASPNTGSTTTSPTTGTSSDTPKKFKIGYDIYFLGNAWSIMFAEEFKAAVERDEYKDIVDVVYTSSEGDTNSMIKNIEDLIAQECDAIIVTPLSTTALNPVLKKARDKGIVVILNATLSDEPEAYDAMVYFDNYNMALLRAEWVAKKLNYKGNVLEITGIEGTAAYSDGIAGHKEIFDKYPDLKILGQVPGEGDYAKTKIAMANVLQVYPDIDAILSLNGDQSLAAMEAMEEQNRPLPIITGEAANGFMKRWADIRAIKKENPDDTMYKDFDSCFFAMPCFISVTALKTAVDILNGETPPFEKDYLYEKTILEDGIGLKDASEADQYTYMDLPDGVQTVTLLSEDQLREIFKNIK